MSDRFVRWRFIPTPTETRTTLTSTWDFPPDEVAMFEQQDSDYAPRQMDYRTRRALEGIPRTLATIKRIAEAAAGAVGVRGS